MQNKNIILVGFMGTGKTVTGRVLAEQTGLELVDMDSLIEERSGRPISELFATEGEAAFRAMERALVQELAQREGLIISTGGGIVLNPDNLADFGKTGVVVCLHATAETLFERLEHDTTRPLLSGNKKAQVREILAMRRPLYEAIAHQIDSNHLDPEERADAILKLYALET